MKLEPFFFVFFFFFFMGLASAGDLQNPDFESPPKNLPANSTDPFVLLNENTTLPGWTFQGTVQYVKATESTPLPGNGHAVQLGQDGKINQTFVANGDELKYVLTFTLAYGGQNCSVDAGLVVSAPDSHGVFEFKQDYGKEKWQSFGHYLGIWGDDQPINLVFESQEPDSDVNSTCWPIVDTLLIKNFITLVQGIDSWLANGGFEDGPEFLSNSTDGILLESAPSPLQSALLQWSIIGTVKYIDSKHFAVPEGNAAVEIVSGDGDSSGIQTAAKLIEGSAYKLLFTLGDANDGCEGDFAVGVQAGSVAQNFTFRSAGTGSSKNFNLTFKAISEATPISFLSYTRNQNKDGMFCGPVVDEVALENSSRQKSSDIKWLFLVFFVVLFCDYVINK